MRRSWSGGPATAGRPTRDSPTRPRDPRARRRTARLGVSRLRSTRHRWHPPRRPQPGPGGNGAPRHPDVARAVTPCDGRRSTVRPRGGRSPLAPATLVRSSSRALGRLERFCDVETRDWMRAIGIGHDRTRARPSTPAVSVARRGNRSALHVRRARPRLRVFEWRAKSLRRRLSQRGSRLSASTTAHSITGHVRRPTCRGHRASATIRQPPARVGGRRAGETRDSAARHSTTCRPDNLKAQVSRLKSEVVKSQRSKADPQVGRRRSRLAET